MTTQVRSLARVLPHLDAASCSAAELMAIAPELVCRLGFNRGLISRVQGQLWYRIRGCVAGPEALSCTTRAVDPAPRVLAPGLPETTVVRHRRPVLIRTTAVERDPWSEQSPAGASYVAAPIVWRDRVVGLVHADRHGHDEQLDEPDRDLLAAFADILGMALRCAALNERLAATQHTLGDLASSLSAASVRIDDVMLTCEGPEGADAPSIPRRRPGSAPLPDALTVRELEVLRLMADGLTNQSIAAELSITPSTVKQHVTHVLRKLGAANRAEAVTRWFRADSAP